MDDTNETNRCPFHDLCDVCHPENDMAEHRLKCNNTNCKKCQIYWAYVDGYRSLDED